MNNENILNLPGFGTVRVINEGGNVLFNGNDIATCLGYSDASKAVRTHCKGRAKRPTLTNGGNQMVNYIPESDVYALITSSRLPNTEEFRRLLFEEILPDARLSGNYQSPFFNGINEANNYMITEGCFRTQFENSMDYYARMLHLSATNAKFRFKKAFENMYNIPISNDIHETIVEYIERNNLNVYAINVINAMIHDATPVNASNNYIVELERSVDEAKLTLADYVIQYNRLKDNMNKFVNSNDKYYIENDEIKEYAPLPFRIKGGI